MLKRKCYLLLALGLNLVIISGCTINCLHFLGTEEFTETFDLKDNTIPEDFSSATISSQAVNDCINPSGDTLESRILPPAGYIRSPTEENSLASFLRTYPVKESDSPLLLYDGTIKKNQSAHAAILQLPLEAEDFQQCADSIMRIYAEYYLSIGEEEKIRFHFTTGFVAEYAKWMEGYRIDTKNGEFRWVKSAGYDASYENFTRCESTENQIELTLLAETINTYLRGISPAARKLFVGRYYFMDSLKEVASYCQMTEARAKSILHRTRIRLKDYLRKEGFDL